MLTTRAPERRAAVARSLALAGVRGVAVLAVLLFHNDVSWAPGGYLGVDVFFVLSGFLITSLLLSEIERKGQIDLARFWRRRFSRLAPALLALVGVVLAFGGLMGLLESTRDMRDDALATLGQVVNWRLTDTVGHSLVGAVRSPFQHCWSLAIEAQFYLVWPPLVALVALRRSPLRARVNVAVLAGVLAIASAVAMAMLVGPAWHTQRAYYGTDTRAQALLVGAVLAAFIGHRFTDRSPSVSPATAVGIVAASTLAVAGLVVAFAAAPTSGDTMYYGLYLLVAVAVAIVLARLVLVPGGPLPALLSSRPLVATGRVSYGLYLWHWPLLLVITSDRTGLTGSGLIAARVVASFAAAYASYFVIERRFSLAGSTRGLRTRSP